MNSSPVCVLGLLLLTLPWAVAGPAGKEFFVSPNGDDAAAGTQSRPFRTLEHARDAVRRLKQVSGVPQGGVSIFLRAGKYELTHSFTLTAEDSGSENAPIRYRAWGNERVTLTGGRAITNLGPLTDPEALRRISPVYHAYIRQADLRALGITDFGKITPRGFRVFHPAGLELFFDGKPMTLARWPNAGDYVRVSRLPAGEAAKIKSISSQGSEGSILLLRRAPKPLGIRSRHLGAWLLALRLGRRLRCDMNSGSVSMRFRSKWIRVRSVRV